MHVSYRIQRPRLYSLHRLFHCAEAATEYWKVEIAVVKNPFRHLPHEDSEASKKHRHKTASWLQREESQFSHGTSSLFFIAHDTPQPPGVTCIQGHEVRPGETTCDHGHPVG